MGMNSLSQLWRQTGQTMAQLYGSGAQITGLEGYGNGLQTPATFYGTLRRYYEQTSLYSELSTALYAAGVHPEAIRGLRNPAHRVVEFYAQKIWPGTLPEALPIETENERIIPAIERVWQWSNWGSQKQVMVRWGANLGDVFIKVCQRPDGSRVYLQLIDPAQVPDFEVDERGYLVYIRIDSPQRKRVGDRVESVTHTEVWDKQPALASVTGQNTGTYRRWEHTKGDEPRLEELGDPVESRALSEFGIDFLPFVHLLWKDTGAPRGLSAFGHALDKIDEANRQATRLHQMLYRHNRNTHVLEGDAALAGDGRPGSIPPPRVNGLAGSTSADAGTVDIGDESLFTLPSGWHLKSMVPELNYSAGLEILNAMVSELERDLPEMVYSRVQEFGELSGRALRIMLSAAIDKALEARGQCEDALIRCHQMALTIGAQAGLPEFKGIGKYEEGAFEHTFKKRDMLPPDTLEEAQAKKAEAEAAALRISIGVSKRTALREMGYDDALIDEMEAENEANAVDAADHLLTALDRGTMAPGRQGALTGGADGD